MYGCPENKAKTEQIEREKQQTQAEGLSDRCWAESTKSLLKLIKLS